MTRDELLEQLETEAHQPVPPYTPRHHHDRDQQLRHDLRQLIWLIAKAVDLDDDLEEGAA